MLKHIAYTYECMSMFELESPKFKYSFLGFFLCAAARYCFLITPRTGVIRKRLNASSGKKAPIKWWSEKKSAFFGNEINLNRFIVDIKISLLWNHPSASSFLRVRVCILRSRALNAFHYMIEMRYSSLLWIAQAAFLFSAKFKRHLAHVCCSRADLILDIYSLDIFFDWNQINTQNQIHRFNVCRKSKQQQQQTFMKASTIEE